MTDPNIWTPVPTHDFRPSEWAGMVSAVIMAMSPDSHSLLLDPTEQTAIIATSLSLEIDQFGNYRISVLSPSTPETP